MWSELDHLNYSRDSPIDSSVSSYSSSAIQQMLKINIDRQKKSNTTDFTAGSTKYNSSYHRLKETRASDILQTLRKFDKKYVNINRAEEHTQSSLSSLDKISVEGLPFTTKITTKTDPESDNDITQKKPVLYSAGNFETKPIMVNFGETNKSKSKNSHSSDYSKNLSPKQNSESNLIQDNSSEISIAEELSNESVKGKPWLKVTVQAKNRNNGQPENNSFVTSENKIKAPSGTEFTEKASYPNNVQKYRQYEHLDYLNALNIKSDYNESKINSSSTSTIHTEPSASMRGSANIEEEKNLGASLLKIQQNELNILPFKVLTLDDLMDESQLSSKLEHDNPPRAFEEIDRNVKQKFTVKNTLSNLSVKQNGQQETDEEIDEILEDSEPHNYTASMENTSNKSEKNSRSSVINTKNLQLKPIDSASDSSKRSVLSENSEELVSVKQSFSKAAKSEKEVSSKNSGATNSNFKEISVKSLKPRELKLPKTFYSVSSQTEANHHETINQDYISLRPPPDKALFFSQGTQTVVKSQSLLPNSQQENESTLEQISANIMMNEVLKQQIKLTKHFIENQQRIHSAYLTTVNQLSANFKPITLEETEQYIKANLQRRPL